MGSFSSCVSVVTSCPQAHTQHGVVDKSVKDFGQDRVPNCPVCLYENQVLD